MTRETKIGLLVGLAFIIVIGILLSDHLTSATEPPQAPLVQAGGNVRSGVMVPGGQTAPPITTIAPQGPVAPQQPIPTQEELRPKKPPVEIVQIGPGNTPTQSRPQTPAIVNARSSQSAHPRPTPPTAQASETEIAGADARSLPIALPPAPVNSQLASIARGMGEDIVPADPPSSPFARNQADASRSQSASAIPAAAKQYKAEPGDSLGKIASKTLGSAGKAAQDAIIALNPTLQSNPNLVVSGRTYLIPASGKVTPSDTQSSPAPAESTATDAPPPATPGIQPVAPNTPAYFYTVKPGDSLTRIAIEQLGTASAVQAIRDLNEDTLNGGDLIRANQKLRLPAKPIASAE